MKKIFASCLVGVVAILASVGLAPAAHAYPDAVINLTVNRQVMYGGESFTATGTSNVACSWNLEWNGSTHTGSGNASASYRTTYTAPAVTKITKIPLNGICSYADPSVRSSARALAGAATWHRTIIITVLPRGSATLPPETGGTLPGTGGPNLFFLLGGLGLLFAGATAVTVARRRADAFDTAAGQA